MQLFTASKLKNYLVDSIQAINAHEKKSALELSSLEIVAHLNALETGLYALAEDRQNANCIASYKWSEQAQDGWLDIMVRG